MTIDSTNLTILQSLAGGILIGLAVCNSGLPYLHKH